MISVGNDVVDLGDIDKERTTDKRYYSKFITDGELELYQPGQMPFYQFVWLLWSVKEAAFKYLSRSRQDLVFSPARTTVDNICISSLPGLVPAIEDRGLEEYHVSTTVTGDGRELHTRSFITDKYIATFATTIPEFENMYWGVKRVAASDADTQSAMVRAFALEQLSELLLGMEVLIISNPRNIPSIFAEQIPMPFMPITLSHHGHYISYAFIAE